ncbi:hypothetical protein DFH06DRAFT_1242039, partial [Mycena polygramma]
VPACDIAFDFDLDLTFTSTPAFDPRLRPSPLASTSTFDLDTDLTSSSPASDRQHTATFKVCYQSLLLLPFSSYIPTSLLRPPFRFRPFLPAITYNSFPIHPTSFPPFPFPSSSTWLFLPLSLFWQFFFDSHADSTSRSRPCFFLFKSPHP